MSSILTFGEILLRLSPTHSTRLKEMHSLDISLGGAELNVAIALSHLGQSTQVCSAVPKNDIGNRVLSGLSSHYIDTKKIVKAGNRMGIYYYEEGKSMRPSNVIYDRENSSIHEVVNTEELDVDTILSGVSTIHVTGITCALSKKIDDFVLRLVKRAKEMGVKVSFDFNYRKKLWTVEQARESYLRILPYVDYCFAGFQDFSTIIEGHISNKEVFSEEKLLNYYQKFQNDYGVEYFLSTKRDVISASKNRIKGFLFNNNRLFKTEPIEFSVEERIGAGDAFAAGVLHGILQKWQNEAIIEFGTMAGILKHSLKGDHSNCTEDEILERLKMKSQDVCR
ncbi:PfkB family carbohydrate kinase [Virgibacillus sp. W0430]|uniref:PfkB family carbohydrate kinase n=1 Tax=Virgibacillus sp. W0430 TaxID=3391580 RepID=UPI003F47932B